MHVITVSREFGSGGRELGKRMAGLLGFEYYDKEIVSMIAQQHNLDEDYVSGVLERGMMGAFPITIGHTLSYPMFYQDQTTVIFSAQQQILKDLATEKDCVIIGQSADAILSDFQPLNIFVYADMEAKVQRCRERAPEDEDLSDRDLRKEIKQVDAGRAKRTELLADIKWGRKERYHLCINTTGLDIESLAPVVAGYATHWFQAQKV